MIRFLLPWVFLFLPFPLLVYFLLPKSKAIFTSALQVPFLPDLQKLYQQQPSTFKITSWKSWLYASLIWVLVINAAAQPIWLGTPMITPMAGRNILLAIDLSGSMEIPDMSLEGEQVSRLDIVKSEARKFIANRVGDRLSLVLFGTKAYLQTPLTFDRQTVMNMLNDASIGLAGTQTAIGDALGLSIKQLLQTPKNSRVIILLTDGGNNAGTVQPLEAAQIAKSQGIRIYTVGLGVSQIVVPGFFGPEVIHPTSDLDEQSLKQIAQITGGIFFRAENSNDLAQVYQSINQIEPVQGTSLRYQSQIELYPWPLSLAFLLLLGGIIKRTRVY